MFQSVGTLGRRTIAFGIAVATVAIVVLLAPPQSRAQDNWVRRATKACAAAGGTLTTPGSGVIFECTFPPEINVLDIFGTPLIDRTLLHICFGPARGDRFGPDILENAMECFG